MAILVSFLLPLLATQKITTMQTKKIVLNTVAISLALSLSFCRKPQTETEAAGDSPMVPALPEQVDDYPASSNDYLAALGRVLFYDKELSANKNISCGSCHQQSHAFTDGMQFGVGTNNEHTKRNTPQIFSRTGKFFWDGRVNAMQDMVLMPVSDQREMSVQDINTLVDRLNTIDYYKPLVAHAFPKDDRLDSAKIKIAVAEFMKNFSFNKNKFNASNTNAERLTPQEQQGKDLFFGRATCSSCHRLSPTAGNEYYGNFAQSHNIGLDLDNPDLGVGAITRSKSDEGAFMTPVLMNVEYTAPYMHDGRFKTLEEVVEHYNSGVKNNPNLSTILKYGSEPKQLNLNDTEKASLVAFLKTLSDPSVLTDTKYSDPFVARTR